VAEIVNLNRVRKDKAKAVAAAEAANNRVLFGRKRADKAADRKAAVREEDVLDGKKLTD